MRQSKAAHHDDNDDATATDDDDAALAIFFLSVEEGKRGRERALGGWQQICVKNSLNGQNCVGQHEKRIKSLKQAIKAAAQVAAMQSRERERAG